MAEGCVERRERRKLLPTESEFLSYARFETGSELTSQYLYVQVILITAFPLSPLCFSAALFPCSIVDRLE